MDQTISILVQAIWTVVGGVVLVALFLIDAVKEHPRGAALLLGIFLVEYIVTSERNQLVGQLQRALEDLERHIDGELNSVERRLEENLRDLSNRLP